MTEPARIGYARCSHSAADQREQHAALVDLRCEPILLDKGLAGAHRACPERLRALDLCEPGATLVVPTLTRAVMSLSDAAAFFGELHNRGVSLEADAVRYPPDDTRLIAAFELAARLTSGLLSLHTRAGVDAAIASGRRRRGPANSLSDAQHKKVRETYAKGRHSMRALAEIYHVSPTTISRTINGPERTSS